MPKYLGKTWTKNELLKYIGDPLQIAGAIPSVLSDGKAEGVKAVTFVPEADLNTMFCPAGAWIYHWQVIKAIL